MELLPQNPAGTSLLLERRPMTGAEKGILTNIRNRKVVFITSFYAAMAAAIIFGIIKIGFWATDKGDENLEVFRKVAPYVLVVLLLALTGYSINYYYKLAHPFVKDLKCGMKDLIHFEPEPYKTPFFDIFYVKTPSQKNAMMRIDKTMYDLIRPGSSACLTLSPYGRFVFSLEIGGKTIYFTEKDARVDV